MPPRKSKDKFPFKGIIIAAVSLIVIIVGIIVVVNFAKSSKNGASPENAIKASGISTDSINKVFTATDLAAAVEVKPGSKPQIYFCSLNDSSWSYVKTVAINHKEGMLDSYLFTVKGSKQAIAIVFCDSKDTASVKLYSTGKTEKDPVSSGAANGLRFFAFTFDNAENDKATYIPFRCKDDGTAAFSGNFSFDEGSFSIRCNNTDYSYKVSECTDVAKAFKLRYANLTPEFSLVSPTPTKKDFTITFKSPTYTLIKPSNTAANAVSYESTSITMPLDGDYNHYVYISDSNNAMIASKEPTALKNAVMKLISGK